ncbi:MAG: hypothetical protein KatS3mg008_1714 [Acidimicrobiales bacterium]|nr:MAG: hypothetical protein KatS3mg008_1714 [Acidimicrobiales bacterium]
MGALRAFLALFGFAVVLLALLPPDALANVFGPSGCCLSVGCHEVDTP